MSNKFLDENGLEVLWGLIKNRIPMKFDENNEEDNNYIPSDGQICLLESNNETKIKIGDGETPLKDLEYKINFEEVQNLLSQHDTILTWESLGQEVKE